MAAIAVDVVRALSAAPELRGAGEGDDSIGTLSGHFSAFNNWYRVSSVWEGEFLEQIAPGAFAKTIAEDRGGMRVLFDHGFDPTLGNKVLGPIRELREEDAGGYYEVPLYDTSYNRDLLPGLKGGQYGASFRMKVEADDWDDKPGVSDFNPNGVPLRTITRSKVMEFGPVTFPANPQASATVRSVTDEFYSRLQQRDRGAYQAACRAADIQFPDFAAANPQDGRPGGSERDSEPRKAAQSTKPSYRRRALHRELKKRGIL